MAGSQIIPLHVSAKVLNDSVTAPTLAGQPFNREHTLEKGIHVHWALPDALTRARVTTLDGTESALFPGVPDLWLVVRLNPAPPIDSPVQKRTWRAWVVDSIEETVTQLDKWTPPALRDPERIHTAVGVLSYAGRFGHKGHGLWAASNGKFDPAVAAYYPACRKRLGLYDPADDVGTYGKVSYTVIGWYSIREHDPLYMTSDRSKLLKNLKLSHHIRPNGFVEIKTSAALSLDPPLPSWMPAIQSTEVATPSAARIADVKKAALRGGSHTEHAEKLRLMQESFPSPATVYGSPVQEVVESLVHDSGPKDILCHGTVLEVPPGGPDTVPAAIQTGDIRLYPSVKRAIADIAALSTTDPQKVEYVEMLLQDLDSTKGSMAGVLDLPGAAHALTFQSVPGKSRFHARLDVHPKQTLAASNFFNVSQSPFTQYRAGSGHWPLLAQRSASISKTPSLDNVPIAVLKEPVPSTPQGPTDAELAAWKADVRAAFATAASAAAAAGKPIDARLLHVHDYRTNAQPLQLGLSANGQGPDGAGWWLDIDDDHALEELLKCVYGAKIHLPHIDNLYEVPGPRWYRPWAPQVVLYGTGRSYKFGFDGRFRADGFIKCRLSSETTFGLSVGGRKTVFGQDILDNPGALFTTAGLPFETRSLVNESALLDTESTGILAKLVSSRTEDPRVVQEQYRTAIRGILLTRDSRLSDADQQLIADKVLPFGDLGSAIGTTLWKDPRDPLFLDTNYAYPHSSVAGQWELKQDHVECTTTGPAATNPPAGQVEVFDERSPLTSTVANVLKSALVTKATLDMQGVPVKAHKAPAGIDEDTFLEMDVISAPLTAFDSMLFDRSHRERTGALRINKLDLVDMFGMVRSWNSGISDPASPDGGPSLPYWTELAPRLPYWSRVQFRLQSATSPSEEATPLAPPICGLLLPDFVEHALEVFDHTGKAIGQLITDRPQFGSTDEVTLQVEFKVHPWVAAALNLGQGSNPLDAIANPLLRSFIESLCAQSLVVPANQLQDQFFETGLTAMLRVIDTVRGTLDPSVKTQDRKVRLIGEPIAVLAARLNFEGSASSPAELTQNPVLLTAPPALPTISVRIGDVTRPDDGVLGCFIAGPTPAEGRFAPVSTEAAAKAIFNGLINGVAYDLQTGLEVAHDFILDQEARFQITANQPRDIVILADIRGGLYATCGVLPRKKISLPKEFLDTALRNMEPTFRVGPIMTFRRNSSIRPVLPPPEIEGLVAEFVHREPDENGGPDTYPETGVPPVPPVGELPTGRVTLDEGWVRMFKEQT